MKKLLVLVCLLLITAINCYEDRETNVRVDLGTVPPGISKIHVAVYEDSIEPENALVTSSFDPGTRATINVPIGDERYFVVVGENSSGIAEYSGVYGPVNLNDPEASLDVGMGLLDGNNLLAISSDAQFAWSFDQETKIGADTYIIHEDQRPVGGNFAVWVEVYRGPSIVNYSGYTRSGDYRFQPYYKSLNLYSASVYTP